MNTPYGACSTYFSKCKVTKNPANHKKKLTLGV